MHRLARELPPGRAPRWHPRRRPSFAELADPHLDDQREGAEVHDDGDDDVRDVLVIGRQVRQLQARDIEHRHEQRREDDADGVTGGEHRNRDAVEADGRERLVRGPEELCVAGEIVERSARRAQSARDRHGDDDVTLVGDTGVARGMTVGAAGFELIAERRLGHHHVNGDCKDDGDEDAAVDLGVRKELVKAHLRGGNAVVGRLVDVAGLGGLGDVLKVADIKEPCDEVRRDPVRHDAGEHLVDVEQGLEKAGDRAPDRTRERAAEEGEQPDERGGHRLGRKTEGDGERHERTDEVLARRADVEKACFIRHADGKARHDERRGTEEHVADIRRVEAPRQRAGGVASRGEQAAEHDADAIPRRGEREVRAREADDQNDDAADGEADQDREDGRRDGLEAFALQEVFFFHTAASSFAMRLAPAM